MRGWRLRFRSKSIDCFLSGLRLLSVRSVKAATSQSHLKPRKAEVRRKKVAVRKFWVRPASRELNRTGEFILKHLPGIRREAPSRAGIA
jgi:hypothetical protein